MRKIKHYNLCEELGSGGMGVVYKAFDTVLERDVAIKIMHRHLLEDENCDARFMREARTVARLVHPNIVTIHEVGKARRGRYIVMEYVDGVSLTRLLAEDSPLPLERAIEMAKQLLGGLNYAHENKVLHRDIKAENILITEAGRVKILDFGIAKVVSKKGLTVEGDLLGTVEYMAPEQLLGEAIDQRCDIFAAGVVFYQMLANRLPFISETPAAILYKELNEDPAPPSFYNREVSSDLDEIVLRAIHRDRDARWESAAAFSSALRELETSASAGKVGTTATERSDGVQEDDQAAIGQKAEAPVFIGREQELRALTSLFRHASRGHGQTAIIMGEAGVGKSTLANRFRNYVRANQAWVLYGACLYQEGMDAYLPYIDALRTFFSRESYSLPEEQRMELKGIVREKAPLLLEFTERFTTSFGPRATEDSPASTGGANLIEGIYLLLSVLARIRPLVLVIDDLQWADEASLRLFHYLSHHVSGNRLLLLGISRTDRFDLQHNGKPGMLMEMLARIRADGNDNQIVLDRLTRENCDLLVDSTFSPNLFTQDFYESIHVGTKGNPLYVTETLKRLRETGDVFLKGEVWHNNDEALAISVPNRVEDIFFRRLSGLEAEEREMLQVAAMQGQKFDPSILAKLVEISNLKVLKALHHIQQDLQLIHSNEQLFQFEHPMLRNLLYNEIPAALRREYHLMIAAELESAYGPHYGALVGDVAQHLRRGGAHAKAAPLLYAAGVRAFSISAYHEAIIYFEDFRDSVERGDTPMQEIADPIEYYFKLAICLEENGKWERSRRAYEKLLELSSARENVKGQTDALLRLGRIQAKLADWNGALDLYERCRQVAEEHGAANVLSRLFNNIGIVYFQTGRIEQAQAYFEKTIDFIDSDPGEFDKAHALTNMGIIANMRAEHDKAMTNYQAALEIYDKSDNCIQDQARIHHNIGITLMDQRKWDEAQSAFQRCLKLVHAVKDRQLQALTYVNMGRLLVRRGQVDKARELVEKALKTFTRSEDNLNVAESYHILGLVYAAKEDFVVAERYLKKCIEINRKLEYNEGLAETYASYAEIKCKRDDLDEAREFYQKALTYYRDLKVKPRILEIEEILAAMDSATEMKVKVVDSDDGGNGAVSESGHAELPHSPQRGAA